MHTSTTRLPHCVAITAVLVTASAGLLAADEPSPPMRVLVDFEDAGALHLSGNRARGEVVQTAGGATLQVSTDAGADYPSVRIASAAAGGAKLWDLRGYEAVTAEVRNPQDVPLRVLLSVNNSQADGQRGCSVAALSLGAGERGVVTVPLGQWHGEARPLDLAAVASFDVLLDRPRQAHQFVVDNIRAVRHEAFNLAAAMNDPFFAELKPPFGRGINLGNALEAPSEGEWGVKLEESYFQAIADAGFDSIRLPVRWSAHAEHVAPYTIDPKFFARVDWAVQQALSRGLSVVLNIHHYSEMDERPDEQRLRYLALWEQIAAHYADRPATLAFELLNEPHDKLTAGKWNAILAEALGIVRRTNPTRTVVIGPVQFNSIRELKSLELPEADRNLVVTVHYYSPFAFTHQGAHWIDVKNRPPVGVKWTGSETERDAVTRDLDTAARWGLEHRRPIYLGEFGALGTADMASRARWTKFVADAALERRMGFAYWEFCSGFGAYDPVKHEWFTPLRDALVPTAQ